MEPATKPSNADQNELALPERRHRRAQIGAMRAVKAAHATDRTRVERFADWLIGAAASVHFLMFHAVWFAIWIAINTGLLGLPRFDPYPFGLLTMIVSLEAIFLSIFVLMSQSRESYIAELREELALQVSLRMEAEVTKTLQLVAGLYTRLGHKVGEDEELRQMLQPLEPEAMEKELTEQIRAALRP